MHFRSLVFNTMVTCMSIAWFISRLFTVNSFNSNSSVGGICGHIPILTVVQNVPISHRKNSYILQKNVVFEALFNLYGNYLSYILTIYCKCFTFQFLSRGIRAYIYIITLIQKGHISGYKHGHILLKNVLLKLHFQHEGHVDVLLSYILTIYCIVPLFRFLSRGISIHVPIITGVQNRRITRQKNSHILQKKCCFWSSFFKMKVTCMLITYLMFWLFTVNALLFSSLVVTNVFTFVT